MNKGLQELVYFCEKIRDLVYVLRLPKCVTAKYRQGGDAMKQLILNLLLSVAIISMLGTIGCGGTGAGPTLPSGLDPVTANAAPETNGSGILGVYDVVFDSDTNVIEAFESRDVDQHYNITTFIRPSVVVSLVSYNPAIQQLIFNLQITNPSALTAYDVRGILIDSAGLGYMLQNYDDYTMLFTPTGLENPFIAYAKGVTGRAFGPGLTYIEQFQVGIPAGIVPPFNFTVIVECSYPGNCDDAYEISNQTVSNAISAVTSGIITVDVFDHQGDLNQVLVDTTPITGGITPLVPAGGTKWAGAVVNTMGVPTGLYRCRIIADSNNTTDDLYDYVTITVGNIGGVTPPPIVPPVPPIPPIPPQPPVPPIPPIPPVPPIPPNPPQPPPPQPPGPPQPPVPPPVPPPTPPPVPPTPPPIPPTPPPPTPPGG